MNTAIESAHKAYLEWRFYPPQKRALYLLKAAQLLKINYIENTNSVIYTSSLHPGKKGTFEILPGQDSN